MGVIPLVDRVRAAVASLLTTAVVAAIGCSDGHPTRYAVSGTVAFESGAPVRNASIEFVPTSPGPSSRGRIDAEGRFSLGTYERDDGAPAGEYHVIVVQALPPDVVVAAQDLGEEHAGHAGEAWVVSLKHASPKTTGVRHTVEPIDANQIAVVVEGG